STKARVTSVAGRGVGMDVVKANIQAIGGAVEIASKVGEGTTIRIKIPLTLAIVPALMVTTGGARYALPQINVLELVRNERPIEFIHGAPVYRLREKLLPIVHLNGIL